MPTITLNRKVFEKLVGKKISLDQLKDRLAMLGTDLEDVTSEEITVEVFPNRPDMLSEQGFARAFSSFIGVKTGLREYKAKSSGEQIVINKSVKDVRPRTSCAIVKNLKFDDERIREVIQIQEKLHVTYGRDRKKCAIGIYPLEKIKFPVTFKALKPEEIRFRPLEFPKEITGRQIMSQHPTGRAYAHLMEGLKKYPIFIDANKQILSMPPIINSHETGKITDDTKDIFIEASGFNQDVLDKVLNILVCMFADMGGEVYSLNLRRYDGAIETPNLKVIDWDLDVKYVNKLLGLNLKDKEVIKYLERMGYDASGKGKLKVKVPAYRADILHQIDFVEDIAIAYGIENFKYEIPNVATIGSLDRMTVLVDQVANGMVGLGLAEVSSLHLTNKDWNFGNMNLKVGNIVELESSMTKDYTCLRSWLLPNLMKIFSENTNEKYPQRIFEIGRVFTLKKEVKEKVKLAGAIADTRVTFTDMKAILDGIFNLIDVKVAVKAKDYDCFITGRAGAVIVGGKEVGYIGEFHPDVISSWGLTVPVAGFEIDLSFLE